MLIYYRDTAKDTDTDREIYKMCNMHDEQIYSYEEEDNKGQFNKSFEK